MDTVSINKKTKIKKKNLNEYKIIERIATFKIISCKLGKIQYDSILEIFFFISERLMVV